MPAKLSFIANEVREQVHSNMRVFRRALSARSSKPKYSVSLGGNFPGIYSRTVRQTKNLSGVWGNTEFKYNGRADIYLDINDSRLCDLSDVKGERWLLHHEPQAYIQALGYDLDDGMASFDRVYTPSPDLFQRKGKFIASAPYVHWLIGRSYDFLSGWEGTEKSVDLVCVNSGLATLDGHRLRNDFILEMCRRALPFHLYGRAGPVEFSQYRGQVKQKWDVYSPARYVLVIENDCHEYYWSEKISDAILASATPIYFGCSNIMDFFPEGSVYQVDIRSEFAIEQIVDIVASDFHEKNIGALQEAKQLVLNNYNLPAFLDHQITEYLG